MDKVTIIDYGINNLKSIMNAFDYLKCDIKIAKTPNDIETANKLILPGVGHFSKAIENLKTNDLDKVIKEGVLDKKIPILGICLGMQLLATFSEEDKKNSKGLDLIPGTLEELSPSEKSLRVPHYGWTNLNNFNQDSVLFKGITDVDDFYFVHSYGFVGEKKYISSTYEYSYDVTASIEKDHIFGVQFHPEKSKEQGLKVLKNFMEYNNG